MTVGNNPVDRSKLGTKRHILTDNEGIPISIVISSVSTDIKLVTSVVDHSIPIDLQRSSFTNKNKDGLYYHAKNKLCKHIDAFFL